MSVEFCVREGEGGYQYWYSTSRSSPLLKSLDPVIDEHSVEQSLRYRRLVYRIISSIISRRYRTRKFLNKNEKRILEYSLPVCLSQRWIRDFLFSPRRWSAKKRISNLWKIIWIPPRSCIRPLSSLRIEVEVKELRLMPAVRKEKQALSCVPFWQLREK